MNKIKKELKEMCNFFKKNILKTTILLGVIFLVSTLSSYLVFKQNPNVSKKIVESFHEATKGMMTLKGLELGTGIFLNNLRACLVTLLMGIIPFVYLVYLVLFTNAALIGAVFSIAPVNTLGKTILFGILPHGIFELPALFISMALSVYLCTFIAKKIFRKEDTKFLYALKEIVLVFLVIVIPLLIIAGLIEGVITPMLLAKFVK